MPALPQDKGLQAARLEAELDRAGATVGRPLTVLEVTTSTNDDARRGAREGAPSGAAWVADHQTGGRGRRGRGWHSPPGENVYLSLLLRLSTAPEKLAPLALVAGLAVADAVDEHLAAGRALIKWPNDLLVDGRKLAGILVETTLRGEEAVVVIGVGLNVLTVDFGPGPFRRPPTSLWLQGARPARDAVAADLLAALGRRTEAYRREGWSEALGRDLRTRDALRGERVRLDDGREGRADGFGPDGALRLVTSDGRIEVRSGEVRP